MILYSRAWPLNPKPLRSESKIKSVLDSRVVCEAGAIAADLPVHPAVGRQWRAAVIVHRRRHRSLESLAIRYRALKFHEDGLDIDARWRCKTLVRLAQFGKCRTQPNNAGCVRWFRVQCHISHVQAVPRNQLNSRWLLLQMQINNVIAAVVLCAVIAVIWGGFAFDMAKAIGLV
jgi:hypothetical protein